MRLFTRRESPPAQLLALFDDGERAVSWADVDGGGVVLATQRGLWWPFEDAPRRIGWEFVDKAVWRDGVLLLTEATLDGELLVDRPVVLARIAVPRDLPPTVRKRVEGSVARSEVRPLPGGSARFVARRVSGRDGVQWWARLEPGTADTPAVRAAVAAQLTALREQWASQLPD